MCSFMADIKILIEAKDYFNSRNIINISVLDIGCGRGLYWKDVYSRIKISKIIGVDIKSDEDLRIDWQDQSFIQTFKEIKDDVNFEFVQSDIVKFVSETTSKFDLIVCFQILSLLEKKSAKLLLSDLKSILCKSGLIALCIPNEQFEIRTVEGVPYFVMNKFNLSSEEFRDFVEEYKIIFHFEKNKYHWALLSCT